MQTSRPVVPNPEARLPRSVNEFPVGASPYAFCNVVSLINKFINKYDCFYNLF